MNGDQLFQSLQTFGLEPDDYGHVVCLMDCWTGRVQSAVLHPDEDKASRSITIVVAAALVDAERGKLLAGGTETFRAEPWRDWQDICNEAITEATWVAVAYTNKAYDSIGFSLERFAEEHRDKMTDEEFHNHLDNRLNYALTREYTNAVAAASMDLPDGPQKKATLDRLDLTYRVLDMSGEILSAVDGQ